MKTTESKLDEVNRQLANERAKCSQQNEAGLKEVTKLKSGN
jgi:hypothetical protein